MKHEEKVIKAWGCNYEKFKSKIQEDGSISNDDLGETFFVMGKDWAKISKLGRLFFIPKILNQ